MTLCMGSFTRHFSKLGIPFSELCKPQFCAELKTRLDHYLSTSQGSSATTTSLSGGRTLGSAAEIERHMLKTAKRKSLIKCS